jgi:hypothetical protein
VATFGEMAKAPGGRIMLLQLAIEEMQDGIDTLGKNQEFIETVIRALDMSGVLTAERIEKRTKMINEKIERCEAPFDRPFIFLDPDAPEDWRKASFWPAPAIKRALKAMEHGEFIPPR